MWASYGILNASHCELSSSPAWSRHSEHMHQHFVPAHTIISAEYAAN